MEIWCFIYSIFTWSNVTKVLNECYFSRQMEVLQLELKEAVFLPTKLYTENLCFGSLSVNQIVVVTMQMSFSHFRRE